MPGPEQGRLSPQEALAVMIATYGDDFVMDALHDTEITIKERRAKHRRLTDSVEAVEERLQKAIHKETMLENRPIEAPLLARMEALEVQLQELRRQQEAGWESTRKMI